MKIRCVATDFIYNTDHSIRIIIYFCYKIKEICSKLKCIREAHRTYTYTVYTHTRTYMYISRSIYKKI